MSYSRISYDIPPVPTWDPAQGDLTRQHGLYPLEVAQRVPGQGKSSPADAGRTLLAQGWTQCPNPKPINKQGNLCGFWISPQVKAQVEHKGGYFTCPRCNKSYDLMEELPWHGPVDAEEALGENFRAGGGTRIGIPLTDQGQIGENLVAKMGQIPGYGPITWWHPGGAGSKSPLDGAVKEWGIEVKTIGYDAENHRFAPGGESGETTIADKNNMAREMGLKGVLGILVLLDYRRDVADIYLKEMPLERWLTSPGKWTQGVAQFRSNTAQKLVAEVPFENPFKDPNNPTPQEYRITDYYQSPPVIQPNQQNTPNEPAPF